MVCHSLFAFYSSASLKLIKWKSAKVVIIFRKVVSKSLYEMTIYEMTRRLSAIVFDIFTQSDYTVYKYREHSRLKRFPRLNYTLGKKFLEMVLTALKFAKFKDKTYCLLFYSAIADMVP